MTVISKLTKNEVRTALITKGMLIRPNTSALITAQHGLLLNSRMLRGGKGGTPRGLEDHFIYYPFAGDEEKVALSPEADYSYSPSLYKFIKSLSSRPPVKEALHESIEKRAKSLVHFSEAEMLLGGTSEAECIKFLSKVIDSDDIDSEILAADSDILHDSLSYLSRILREDEEIMWLI